MELKVYSRKGESVTALIDEDDYDLINQYYWGFTKRNFTTYIRGRPKNNWRSNAVFMHRVIMGMPKGCVDHKNGDGLDNRKQNLRVCSYQENGRNCKNRKSKYGYKGISWDGNYFAVYITINYKRIYVGKNKSLVEAAEMYNKAAVKHFGEFASLNKISEEDRKKWDLIVKTPKTGHPNSDNKSGYRGVCIYFENKKIKYIASISHNNKSIKIGRFKTALEAAEAYNKKAIELKGGNALLNNI